MILLIQFSAQIETTPTNEPTKSTTANESTSSIEPSNIIDGKIIAHMHIEKLGYLCRYYIVLMSNYVKTFYSNKLFSEW